MLVYGCFVFEHVQMCMDYCMCQQFLESWENEIANLHNESSYSNPSLLPNTMNPHYCLLLNCRIPPWILHFHYKKLRKLQFHNTATSCRLDKRLYIPLGKHLRLQSSLSPHHQLLVTSTKPKTEQLGKVKRSDSGDVKVH